MFIIVRGIGIVWDVICRIRLCWIVGIDFGGLVVGVMVIVIFWLFGIVWNFIYRVFVVLKFVIYVSVVFVDFV